MNQTELVYQYMQENGSITSGDAWWKLGVSRLSARVYELRHMGKPIDTKRKKVSTRYGKTYVTEYRIAEEGKGDE